MFSWGIQAWVSVGRMRPLGVGGGERRGAQGVDLSGELGRAWPQGIFFLSCLKVAY